MPLLFFGVCKKNWNKGSWSYRYTHFGLPFPSRIWIFTICEFASFFFFFFLVKILGWVPSSKPMLPAYIGKLHDQFKVQFQSNCVFYEEIHPVTLSRTINCLKMNKPCLWFPVDQNSKCSNSIMTLKLWDIQNFKKQMYCK